MAQAMTAANVKRNGLSLLLRAALGPDEERIADGGKKREGEGFQHLRGYIPCRFFQSTG